MFTWLVSYSSFARDASCLVEPSSTDLIQHNVTKYWTTEERADDRNIGDKEENTGKRIVQFVTLGQMYLKEASTFQIQILYIEFN